MDAQEPLLTLHDVAVLVQVSESTVRRWVRNGELEAYKIGQRGQVRISRPALTTFLEKQRAAASTGGK